MTLLTAILAVFFVAAGLAQRPRADLGRVCFGAAFGFFAADAYLVFGAEAALPDRPGYNFSFQPSDGSMALMLVGALLFVGAFVLRLYPNGRYDPNLIPSVVEALFKPDNWPGRFPTWQWWNWPVPRLEINRKGYNLAITLGIRAKMRKSRRIGENCNA